MVNHFLRGHLKALAQNYDINLGVNVSEPYRLRLQGINCRVVPIRIERKIAPLRDFVALVTLLRCMRAGEFALVHSFTPKAGLLAMIAGWLTRVPLRLHTFQGEVWVTRRGFMRRLLKAADWLTARLTTHALVVGEGERQFLIREGVLEKNSIVLAKGSIAGIDVECFRPNPAARDQIRTSLKIGENATVLLFLGRIARDKGIMDLANAFRCTAEKRPDLHLVVAGPDEENLRQEIDFATQSVRDRVHFAGLLENPADWLAAADILCLPSYREGFPVVILEAAGVGIPSLGSRIYGVSDAIVDGVTGLLHEPANVPDISSKLSSLVDDRIARVALGQAARARVIKDFDSRQVITALVEFYRQLDPGGRRPSRPRKNSPFE